QPTEVEAEVETGEEDRHEEGRQRRAQGGQAGPQRRKEEVGRPRRNVYALMLLGTTGSIREAPCARERSSRRSAPWHSSRRQPGTSRSGPARHLPRRSLAKPSTIRSRRPRAISS